MRKLILALLACWASLSVHAVTEVKVVIVSMFEHGALTGDRPGEFQFWVERLPLPVEHDFPAGPYPLRANADGALGICIGGGIANAAASVMALGFDPRFDLTHAYWLIAGIAGGDPEDVSLGSAVWARHVVDGDLLYEIDAREIPEGWPYGLVPLGAEEPAQDPADIGTGWTIDNIHFALNAPLAEWAATLTREHALPDSEALQAGRAAYVGYARALEPPTVMLGDTLSASTYWHGTLLNAWANDWVRLYGGEDAEFVTTNMEDSGTLTALARLADIGKADMNRVLVLRTVSNFSMPPPGKKAAWSATVEYPGQGRPGLEAAYQVGRVVVQALIKGWKKHRETPPHG